MNPASGFAALLGLLVGSFLNVVVHRLPAGESLVAPGSHCPSCGAPIRARHNVPVLGWLSLGGRCVDCRTRISPRYPLVELGTGLAFAAVAWRLHRLDLLSAGPAYLWFTGAGIALALIDLDVRRLPNAIVLPSYPVLVILLAGSAAWQHDWWPLVRALVGCVGLFALYLLLVLVHPAGMGWGDVKLAGLLGLVLAYLSWTALLVGAFAGFLLGAAVAVGMLASGRAGRKSALPFGPFMIAGVFVALFAAPALGEFYRGLLDLS